MLKKENGKNRGEIVYFFKEIVYNTRILCIRNMGEELCVFGQNL